MRDNYDDSAEQLNNGKTSGSSTPDCSNERMRLSSHDFRRKMRPYERGRENLDKEREWAGLVSTSYPRHGQFMKAPKPATHRNSQSPKLFQRKFFIVTLNWK